MIKSSKLSIIFLVLASITLLTHALPAAVSVGNQITLDSSTICTYLPPDAGGNISEHEDDAVPFCNTLTPPNVGGGVNLIPDGFILTSHFASGDGFVQYTGRIDPSKYGLDPNDEGGQYDSVG